MRHTHTFVELEISEPAYREIREKLAAADYGHHFVDEKTIDMTGLAVTPEVPRVIPIPVYPPHHEPEPLPTAPAWEALVMYAYLDGKDGAVVIQQITEHYLHMRSERDRLRAEVARLEARQPESQGE